MGALQVLEDKLSGQGFHVLGFLENDFGGQGGDMGQIDACTNKYHVTFPQFQLGHVVGPETQPVFAWLYKQPNPGPAPSVQPPWNFQKWLISRDGKLVADWDPNVWPGADPSDPTSTFDGSPVVIAIKAEIAKPKP